MFYNSIQKNFDTLSRRRKMKMILNIVQQYICFALVCKSENEAPQFCLFYLVIVLFYTTKYKILKF